MNAATLLTSFHCVPSVDGKGMRKQTDDFYVVGESIQGERHSIVTET